MRPARQMRGDRRRYQCLPATLSGGVLDREDQGRTDDIDSCAASGGTIILVLEVQGGITGPAQLVLR
jgi:hypothetical protein